jgi:hypothetical protein
VHAFANSVNGKLTQMTKPVTVMRGLVVVAAASAGATTWSAEEVLRLCAPSWQCNRGWLRMVSTECCTDVCTDENPLSHDSRLSPAA